MKDYLIIIYVSFTSLDSHSQIWDSIKLSNPSFEDTPSCCKPPVGWAACGFDTETPPDIHPALNFTNQPLFNVTKNAMNGKTYLGMVVRENSTIEAISQKLETRLLENKCYSFSIYLCRSTSYSSGLRGRAPNQLVEFTEPVIFRAWSGDAHCHEKQILIISGPIENTEWKKYEFPFKVNKNASYILFEAYYNTSKRYPYNGHVLLDNASDIIQIDCDLLDNK